MITMVWYTQDTVELRFQYVDGPSTTSPFDLGQISWMTHGNYWATITHAGRDRTRDLRMITCDISILSNADAFKTYNLHILALMH